MNKHKSKQCDGVIFRYLICYFKSLIQIYEKVTQHKLCLVMVLVKSKKFNYFKILKSFNSNNFGFRTMVNR